MENLRAVIYIRVSDQSQIDNNSLETQLKTCKIYAQNNNYEVVQIFREEGMSAKHMQTRPEMRNLIEYCTIKKNKISAVILYKMDRWSRNVEEGLLVESLLAKYGVAVIPATEITEQNPIGKAVRTILMTMGQLDNELKGERVRDNMKTMFKNGLWCWKPRMGYKRPFKTKEENKGKTMIIDDRLGEILRALFIKASETNTSKKYLADYINSIGFKEIYGTKADGRLVSRTIKDSFYYGYMYAPKWKEYAWGKHEPLITQDIWERANTNLFGRKRKNKFQDNTLYPLKGILCCSTCSRTMTSSNPKGTSKNYLYYECHNSRCSKKERIGIDNAHKEFIALLGSIQPSERVLKLFNHLVFSEWDKSIEDKKREAKILDAQIDGLDEKLTGIAESNMKHILTDEEAQIRADEYRKEIAVLRVERSEIRIDQYDQEAVRSFIENFLVHIDRLWIQIELSHKQALQSAIFPENIFAENGKVRTNGLASTFKLIEALGDPNVDLVTQAVTVRNQVVPDLINYYHLFSQDISRLQLQPSSYSV